MIVRNKIELSFREKLKYYRVSIGFCTIAIFCLFTNFSFNLSPNYFTYTSSKIGLIILGIALIIYIKLNQKLKFKKKKLNLDKTLFLKKLNALTKKHSWEIHSQNEYSIILKTNSNGANGRFFLSKSYGEIIYIFFDQQILYYRSIFDFDKNLQITIPTGENIFNEKLISTLDKVESYIHIYEEKN